MSGSSLAALTNLLNPSRFPLSVQFVPRTYNASKPKYGSTARKALTAHPTPTKRIFFNPLASTSAKTLRFGDRLGFTPRALMISSVVVANIGLGARGSSGCPATHTTPSTAPVSNIFTATDVTIPVHCAPVTGRFFAA